ncbi:hypothetical protein LSTR_LSTR002196 [Laodelphax striatellus]|uniref:Uncharacterized protein n=1 Tax=Laodelphax striatellus TaxID=195883 RepID=A0A482XRL3_LAOST|nr:hypothetical protein LSTR_LSTR002196 [Laodelphax striatellus]
MKVMVDMLVQGKLDETPTENGLVDEKQAKNTKSATHEEPSPPTQDMIDKSYGENKERNQDNQLDGNKEETPKNLKSDGIVAEKIHGKQAKNIESAKDEQPSPPTQDMIDRNYEENKKRNQDDQLKENALDGNEKNNLKSDEIEIEIEWTEDGEQTAYRADSRTESERWSEGDLRPRTSSQLEYQRFVNEFANFSVEWI